MHKRLKAQSRDEKKQVDSVVRSRWLLLRWKQAIAVAAIISTMNVASAEGTTEPTSDTLSGSSTQIQTESTPSRWLLRQTRKAERELRRIERKHSPTDPMLLGKLRVLAYLYGKCGRVGEKETALRRAVSIAEDAWSSPHEELAFAYSSLAGFLTVQGRPTEALPFREKVIQLASEIYGETSDDYAVTLAVAATTHMDLDDQDKATDLLGRANAILDSIPNPDPKHAADIHLTTGNARMRMGDSTAATASFNKWLELERARDDADPRDLASAINVVASRMWERGDLEQASVMISEALEIRLSYLGEHHPDVAESRADLATLFSLLGRNREALELQKKALRSYLFVLGWKHPTAIQARVDLGWLLYGTHDYEGMMEVLDEALGISPLPPALEAAAREARSYALQGLGRSTEAIADLERKIELKSGLGTYIPEERGIDLNMLARLHLDLGNNDLGLELSEEALAVNLEASGKRSIPVATSLNNLGYCYNILGKHENASSYLRQAISVREGLSGSSHPSLVIPLNNLADALFEQGNVEAAMVEADRALSIQVGVQGPRHPDVLYWRLQAAYRAFLTGQYKAATVRSEAVVADVGDSSDLEAYGALATSLMARCMATDGDLDLAIRTLDGWLVPREDKRRQGRTGSGLLWLERALLLDRQDQRAQALEAYALASELNRLVPMDSLEEGILVERWHQAHQEEDHAAALAVQRDLLSIAEGTKNTEMIDTRRRVLVNALLSRASELVFDEYHRDPARALLLAEEGIRRSSDYGLPPTHTGFHGVMIHAYLQLGDDDHAVEIAQDQLELHEAQFGPDSPELLDALLQLGIAIPIDDIVRRLEVEERRLAIQRVAFGDQSAEVLESLEMVGALAFLSGKLDRAEATFLDAARVAEALHPSNGVRIAGLLDRAASSMCLAGRFDEGIAAIDRAWGHIQSGEDGVAIQAKTAILKNRAHCSYLQGDDRESLQTSRKVLQLLASAHGLQAPETLSQLQELVDSASALGADPGFALTILNDFERELNAEVPEGPGPAVSALLSTLRASLFRRLGEQQEALTTLDDAWSGLAASGQSWREGPAASSLLAEYARVFLALGDQANALAFLEDARSIRTDSELGLDTRCSTEPAFISLMIEAGHFVEAHEELERWNACWTVEDDVNGPGERRLEVSLAFSSSWLSGKLALAEGRYRDAREELEHADTACRLALMEAHSVCLESRRLLSEATERTFGAEHALTIAEKTADLAASRLEADSPYLASFFVDVAYYRWANGDVLGARELLHSAAQSRLEIMAGLLSTGSERDRTFVAESYRALLDIVLTIYDEPTDAKEAYDIVLQWKGAVASSSADIHQKAMRSRDPKVVRTLRRYESVSEVHSRLILDPPFHLSVERLLDQRRDLERDRAGLERRIARLLQNATEGGYAASSTSVCEGLREGETLVDLIRFERYDPWSPSMNIETYAAFVLTGGQCGEPHRVDLGDASEIDAAVGRLRAALAAGRGAQSAARDEASALGRLLWTPLEPLLGSRHRILIVPDAELSTVPFSTLTLSDRTLALERYAIGYLDEASRLVGRGTPSPSTTPVHALVVGGVDFGDASIQSPVHLSVMAEGPGCIGTFSPLMETRGEALEIAGALEGLLGSGVVQSLSGGAAEEAAVREAMERSSHIHLATHGYLAPPECDTLQEERLGLRAYGSASSNPMALSGIVLAGVNARGETSAADNDGVLSAEEVSHLDLSNLKVAVLSACSTGLGETTAGQGVLGLRRAFALAGAGELVVSLWDVEDEPTRDLMRAFYAEMARGGDVLESLTIAQRTMLERNLQEFGEPRLYTWGAFIVSGTAH